MKLLLSLMVFCAACSASAPTGDVVADGGDASADVPADCDFRFSVNIRNVCTPANDQNCGAIGRRCPGSTHCTVTGDRNGNDVLLCF